MRPPRDEIVSIKVKCKQCGIEFKGRRSTRTLCGRKCSNVSWRLKKLKGIEYSIKEVYYDDKGEPKHWSVEPQYICAESVNDMRWDLILINQAFKRPILEEIKENGKIILKVTKH